MQLVRGKKTSNGATFAISSLRHNHLEVIRIRLVSLCLALLITGPAAASANDQTKGAQIFTTESDPDAKELGFAGFVLGSSRRANKTLEEQLTLDGYVATSEGDRIELKHVDFASDSWKRATILELTYRKDRLVKISYGKTWFNREDRPAADALLVLMSYSFGLPALLIDLSDAKDELGALPIAYMAAWEAKTEPASIQTPATKREFEKAIQSLKGPRAFVQILQDRHNPYQMLAVELTDTAYEGNAAGFPNPQH